ncbi:MAG: hypothetical protein R3C53_26610 [Pirellulaceae bacterium]
MNTLNPELESQVSALASLCCSALNREGRDIVQEAKPLIQALVRGGYARLSDCNLQTRLEARVLDLCQDAAIHRRGELAGITGHMQSELRELTRWETKKPIETEVRGLQTSVLRRLLYLLSLGHGSMKAALGESNGGIPKTK